MKKLKAAFKGKNFKQMAVDHGEKAGLVLVGLFVVVVLAAMTPIANYGKAPMEFINKADLGAKNLAASQWPEEDQKAYALTGELEKSVSRLVQGVNVAAYEYSEPFYHPLHPKKEKLRIPGTVMVADLKADAGRVLLELRDEEELDASGDLVAEADTDADSPLDLDTEEVPSFLEEELGIVSDLSQRQGSNPNVQKSAGPAGGAGAGYEGMPGEMMFPEGYGEEMYDDSAMYADGMMPGMEGYYGMDGMGMAARPKINGKGFRYVAIRGTVDYKAQVEKIARALGISVPQRAVSELRYKDFEVERQRAVSGENPWSGPWEPVDMTFNFDLLENQIASFDMEVVPAEHTESVFTSPLPGRIAGWWSKDATHPTIKKFLSEQEAAIQKALDDKVVEKSQKEGTAPTVAKKGGFAKIQAPIREMRYGMGSGMMDMMQEMQGDMMGMMDAGYADEYGGYMDEYAMGMESMYGGMGGYGGGAVAQPLAERTLLFRFFDFTAKPGNAYRYRVRLLLENPCYGKAVEELMDPAAAEQEDIATPWSDPSTPAVMPKDAQYFLTDVLPESGEASIEVVQWYEETASFINAELRRLGPGQYIGGQETAMVLRPQQSLEEETDVKFDTDDMLLAVSDLPAPRPGDFPKLQLGRAGVNLPERAIVLNGYGEIKSLDTVSREVLRGKWKEAVAIEREDWENLKKQQMAPGGGYGGEGGYGEAMYEMMMQMGGAQPGMGMRAQPGTRGAAGNRK